MAKQRDTRAAGWGFFVRCKIRAGAASDSHIHSSSACRRYHQAGSVQSQGEASAHHMQKGRVGDADCVAEAGGGLRGPSGWRSQRIIDPADKAGRLTSVGIPSSAPAVTSRIARRAARDVLCRSKCNAAIHIWSAAIMPQAYTQSEREEKKKTALDHCSALFFPLLHRRHVAGVTKLSEQRCMPTGQWAGVLQQIRVAGWAAFSLISAFGAGPP
jgi:hypothetical protein